MNANISAIEMAALAAATRQSFEKAEKAALEYVELRARLILSQHPCLEEFVMGMGVASFTKTDTLSPLDLSDREYFKPLREFIEEWDDFLHLTGNPMRFTATSPKITNW